VFPIDGILLTAALLALAGVALSKVSARYGIPALVLFVGLGMLAGSEGPGGIAFENYALANALGTLALVLILFDGGLRTSREAFRVALAPATVLATAGVAVTAAITGAAASWILGVPLLEGLLLGAIVGSTDAAVVFAVLRSKGLHLGRKVAATLEVESGANDPMAVFLTVCLAQIVVGSREAGPGLVGFLALQGAIGAAVGLLVGYGASHLLNRIHLGAAGLYPVLAAASGLLAYGAAASVGGSGFLAVYLAGVVLGGRRIVFRRGIFLFHDGLAWLAQIAMFVVLGLLSFPSRVMTAAGRGLVVALVLMFVARPVAVFGCLLPFRYRLREMVFVSWVGLRGAVPIVLATIPLLLGYAGGGVFFDVVFFVVIVSALAQGWTVPVVARWLRLEAPAAPEPPLTLEISSLRELPSDIVDYTATPGCAAAGRLIRELELPGDVVVAMIVRGERVVPARGSTTIEPGDHVFLVVPDGSRAAADRVFCGKPGTGRS
jgi:potassium/hydrogen antiporter